MKKRQCILFLLLTLTIKLSGQIVYDTIPETCVTFGGHYWDKLFIIKDVSNQVSTYFKNVDFSQIDCKGQRVFVATTFGENGELKNTRLIKSTSPMCDSIAFYFVKGLNDWLPGLQRGRFIDIPFGFSIPMDSIELIDNYATILCFLDGTKGEFDKRNAYFDFYQPNGSQKIINDFQYFVNYLTEKRCRDSLYVYNWGYRRPAKKNRIKVEIMNNEKDSINYIVFYPDTPQTLCYILANERSLLYWDNKSWGIVSNFRPAKRKSTLYIEKNKKTVLIGFIMGEKEPRLAINRLIFESDTTLNLDFKVYVKQDLMNELSNYGW